MCPSGTNDILLFPQFLSDQQCHFIKIHSNFKESTSVSVGCTTVDIGTRARHLGGMLTPPVFPAGHLLHSPLLQPCSGPLGQAPAVDHPSRLASAFPWPLAHPLDSTLPSPITSLAILK